MLELRRPPMQGKKHQWAPATALHGYSRSNLVVPRTQLPAPLMSGPEQVDWPPYATGAYRRISVTQACHHSTGWPDRRLVDSPWQR